MGISFLEGDFMKVTVLLENTAISSEFHHKHGLSLYLEANGQKILSDMGDDDFFIDNGKKLNIDIGNVDFAVISHGHGDHGGALSRFLNVNEKAFVYVREDGFKEYASKSSGEFRSAGLNPELERHPQIKLVPEYYEIDKNTILFSKVDSNLFFPKSNDALYKMEDGEYVKDDFSHEQYLIIKENNKNFLISGCAHKGVLNIIKSAEKVVGGKIDACISGFHLYSPGTMEYEREDFIKELAQELKASGTDLYTCHCTGEKAFNILEEVLGEQIKYIRTGMTFEV